MIPWLCIIVQYYVSLFLLGFIIVMFCLCVMNFDIFMCLFVMFLYFVSFLFVTINKLKKYINWVIICQILSTIVMGYYLSNLI